MIDRIKKKAEELLRTKQVDLIIGYKRAPDGVSVAPVFIDKAEETKELIWDTYCVYNLSNYLKDFRGRKIGIIAKACDARSIIVLLQENQLKRKDIFIIGVECSGIVDEKKLLSISPQTSELGFDERCRSCKPSKPPIYDVLIVQEGQRPQAPRLEKDPYGSVRKSEAKSISEKFKLWQEEFSRCIRCYACRQICPLCYCPRCVADQTQPSWLSRAHSFRGNFTWNVTRAMHLAGRCIDCGECERACPVGIPLRDINKKIEKDVKELFNYEAGLSAEQKALLSCFDKNDPEDFIR